MRKFIVLQGRGNCGKSNTISMAYGELEKKGIVIHKGERANNRRNGLAEIKGAILEIDGVRVGIASPGDRDKDVQRYVSPLIKEGCEIILCASRKRGSSSKAIERLASEAEPPYEIEWIKKTCVQSSHEDGNQKKCSELVSKVLEAVENSRSVAV